MSNVLGGGASINITKHCSILNYLKHKSPLMHELIEELCMGRVFTPILGAPGITFLRPDKTYLDKLIDIANKDAMECVKLVRSLIIYDKMENYSAFQEKQADIPSGWKTRIPVHKVEKDKVYLTDKTFIVMDNEFKARQDRDNMYVYVISGDMLDVSTKPPTNFTYSQRSNPRGAPGQGRPGQAVQHDRAAKKGGAEFEADRKALFNKVLHEQMNIISKTVNIDNDEDRTLANERNPAMEVLVSLLVWSSKEGKSNLHDCICSQLSKDTLTSLAIVLRPFSKSNQELYLSNDDFNTWAKKYGSSEFKDIILYSYIENPVTYYKKCMSSCQYLDLASKIRSKQKEIAENTTKPESHNDVIALLKEVSCRGDVSARIKMAEAELRTYCAVMHDNGGDVSDLQKVYTMMNVLDEPYFCTSASEVANMSKLIFVSTMMLIIRSDSLYYMPCVKDESYKPLSTDVAKETSFIALDAGFSLPDDDIYNKKIQEFKDMLSQFAL